MSLFIYSPSIILAIKLAYPPEHLHPENPGPVFTNKLLIPPTLSITGFSSLV